MPSILGALKDPFSAVLSAAGEIIGRFVASPEDKLRAQLELAKLGTEQTVKLAELDAQITASQAAVVTSEVKSDSWLARNWRPILMVTFTYIIAHTYVFVPLFGLRSVEIPPDMWQLLKLGIGGYVIGRSAEKTVPGIITAVRTAGQGAPSDDKG